VHRGGERDLYREHYVNVRKSSLDLRGTNRPLGAGWYADALIPLDVAEVRSQSDGPSPATQFAIASHQNQPV
jgi:hypothetical protein